MKKHPEGERDRTIKESHQLKAKWHLVPSPHGK